MNGTPILNGRRLPRVRQRPAEPMGGMSAPDRSAVAYWLQRGLCPGEIAPLLGVTEYRIYRWLRDLADYDRALSR